MNKILNEKKVAILMTDGFEESEFLKPKERLIDEGALVKIISLNPGKISSWSRGNWGEEYDVDITIGDADPGDFDALLLPGGVINADKIRMNPEAIQFASSFLKAGKPVAAICHGLWLLIETGQMGGRNITSYPSIKTDLMNAGAKWQDAEVVIDNGLVTSRNPADLPSFCDQMVVEFATGIHEQSL